MPSPETLPITPEPDFQCGSCQSSLIETTDFMELAAGEVFMVCHCPECQADTGIVTTEAGFKEFEGTLDAAEMVLTICADKLEHKNEEIVVTVPEDFG